MDIIICAGKSVRALPINADGISLDLRLDVHPIFFLIDQCSSGSMYPPWLNITSQFLFLTN